MKLKKINIGGTNYPIIMDINVLEHIQNEYESINQFERDILGLRYQKDENGNQQYDMEGKPKMYVVEPSIKAIKVALPSMINEALAIEADEKNTSWEPVTEEYIFRECTISFEVLARIIHDEYKRCFKIKKA